MPLSRTAGMSRAAAWARVSSAMRWSAVPLGPSSAHAARGSGVRHADLELGSPPGRERDDEPIRAFRHDRGFSAEDRGKPHLLAQDAVRKGARVGEGVHILYAALLRQRVATRSIRRGKPRGREARRA